MHILYETKTLELLKPKVHICNFIFKFPVDCDVIIHDACHQRFYKSEIV